MRIVTFLAIGSDHSAVFCVPYSAVLFRFYTCVPTRTEKLLLRTVDGPSRHSESPSKATAPPLMLLVRDRTAQHGGAEQPALGLKHTVDGSMMQVIMEGSLFRESLNCAMLIPCNQH